jgi:putative inorganic carbon (hco3(-)) transporter
MKIVLIIATFITLSTSILYSWIGIIAYYTLAILAPQHIWFWLFTDLRLSLFVSCFTFAGVLHHYFRIGFDWRYLFTKINFWVLILYISVLISYLFGSHVHNSLNKQFDPDTQIIDISKIFLFYFITTFVINDIKKIKFFSLLLVFIVAFYCYWANQQYLTENWSQFNYGRLMGPLGLGRSVYHDENALAMLFVAGLPFLFYYSFQFGTKIKYVFWVVILSGFHGIFLTGSRGGLLGLIVIVLTAVFWIDSGKNMRLLKILVVPVFLILFFWQAGNIMHERSNSIIAYQGEDSAEGRLKAWIAGLGMFADHPITGVGLSSFITAFPEYNGQIAPRVAHNTFIQFIAENGFFAGLAYIVIVLLFFSNSRKISKWCQSNTQNPHYEIIKFCANSSVVSFLGLTVCSLFLSTNFYEIYFYLIAINNSLSIIVIKEPNLQSM